MASGIVDSKDVIDIERYLDQKEKEITCMDHLLGPELFTLPQYISGSRSIMFTAHSKQFVTLNDPQFPRVFTNYENTFGELSSSLQKAQSDLEVFKIIDKFPWAPKHLYVIFLYDKKEDKYISIIKEIAADLTEKFGYGFNNTFIDSLKEGDHIDEGTTLIKSTSYDQYNNYCYGRNALTCYLIDNRTIEDAVVVSESFSKSMVSKEIETVKISINENDLLLNIYGDSQTHKGFPDVGEKIKGKLIASKRRIDNNQLLYDMKKANLTESNPLNDKEFYSKGRIMDINIYCNRPIEEIPNIACYEQILKYLSNQERYWQEIFETCAAIEASGSSYDNDIGFLYARARQYLNQDFRWKDNDSVFNNIIMEIGVERDVDLNIGYKISGRYGNKGVISTIVPDEEMPMLDNGRHVDVIFNALGVINRLNSAQLFEVSINFISDRVLERMNTFKTRKEKEDLFFDYMSYFDERKEKTKLLEYYTALSDSKKDEFFESLNETGIFINIPPISKGKPLFDILSEIYDTYTWIKPYDCYINIFGRKAKMMEPIIAGEEYIIKLKQTAKKNFSVRSTGYLSQNGLPDKSNKSKHNQQLYSTTPIKIGRDENNNLAIGIDSRTLAKFHLFYRSSPAARREMGKLFTKNCLNFKKFKIKDTFKNRNAEILGAYFKSEGYKIDYGFRGVVIRGKSDMQRSFMYRGVMHICTAEEMRENLLDERWRSEFNQIAHVDSVEKVEEAYQEYARKERKKLDKISHHLTGCNQDKPKKKKHKIYVVKTAEPKKP